MARKSGPCGDLPAPSPATGPKCGAPRARGDFAIQRVARPGQQAQKAMPHTRVGGPIRRVARRAAGSKSGAPRAWGAAYSKGSPPGSRLKKRCPTRVGGGLFEGIAGAATGLLKRLRDLLGGVGRGAKDLGACTASMEMPDAKGAGERYVDAVLRLPRAARKSERDEANNCKHQTTGKDGDDGLLTPPPMQRLGQPLRAVLHDHCEPSLVSGRYEDSSDSGAKASAAELMQ